MSMTRLGNRKVPRETAIRKSVNELFDYARSKSTDGDLLTALLPIDPTPGSPEEGIGPTISYSAEYVFGELQRFVKFFHSLLAPLHLLASDCRANKEIGFSRAIVGDLEEELVSGKTRILVLVYVHVMEAEFFYRIAGNLYRSARRDPCEMSFVSKKTNGQLKILSPGKRIEDLKRLARGSGTRFPDVLGHLWWPELRNAFVHSSYYTNRDGSLTRLISPALSDQRWDDKQSDFSSDTLEALYWGVQILADAFYREWKSAQAPFQTGESYETQFGRVRWNATSQMWRWDQ